MKRYLKFMTRLDKAAMAIASKMRQVKNYGYFVLLVSLCTVSAPMFAYFPEFTDGPVTSFAGGTFSRSEFFDSLPDSETNESGSHQHTLIEIPPIDLNADDLTEAQPIMNEAHIQIQATSTISKILEINNGSNFLWRVDESKPVVNNEDLLIGWVIQNTESIWFLPYSPSWPVASLSQRITVSSDDSVYDGERFIGRLGDEEMTIEHSGSGSETFIAVQPSGSQPVYNLEGILIGWVTSNPEGKWFLPNSSSWLMNSPPQRISVMSDDSVYNGERFIGQLDKLEMMMEHSSYVPETHTAEQPPGGQPVINQERNLVGWVISDPEATWLLPNSPSWLMTSPPQWISLKSDGSVYDGERLIGQLGDSKETIDRSGSVYETPIEEQTPGSQSVFDQEGILVGWVVSNSEAIWLLPFTSSWMMTSLPQKVSVTQDGLVLSSTEFPIGQIADSEYIGLIERSPATDFDDERTVGPFVEPISDPIELTPFQQPRVTLPAAPYTDLPDEDKPIGDIPSPTVGSPPPVGEELSTRFCRYEDGKLYLPNTLQRLISQETQAPNDPAFAGPNDSVHLVDGSLRYDHVISALRSIMPLNLTIHHNGASIHDGPVGIGWDHNFNEKVWPANASTFVGRDGMITLDTIDNRIRMIRYNGQGEEYKYIEVDRTEGPVQVVNFEAELPFHARVFRLAPEIKGLFREMYIYALSEETEPHPIDHPDVQNQRTFSSERLQDGTVIIRDCRGRIIRIYNRNGEWINVVYHPEDGKLDRRTYDTPVKYIESSSGVMLELKYRAIGPQSLVNTNLRGVHIEGNRSYQMLASVTDSFGRSVAFDYGSDRRLEKVTLEVAHTPYPDRVAQWMRVTGAQLPKAQTTGREGFTTSFDYKSSSDGRRLLLNKVIKPGEQVSSTPYFQVEYDYFDRVSSLTFGGDLPTDAPEAGGTYQYFYPSNLDRRIIDPAGNTRQVHLQPIGLFQVVQIDTFTGIQGSSTTRHEHNAFGQKTLTTLPEGNQIVRVYKMQNSALHAGPGGADEVRNIPGYIWKNALDAGKLESIKRVSNKGLYPYQETEVTILAYDIFNQPIAISDSEQNVTHKLYERGEHWYKPNSPNRKDNGNPTASVAPNTTRPDFKGVKKTNWPAGVTFEANKMPGVRTDFTYHQNGLLASQKVGSYLRSYEYNQTGVLTMLIESSTDPQQPWNATHQSIPDAHGNIIKEINPGLVTTRWYNDRDQQIAQIRDDQNRGFKAPSWIRYDMNGDVIENGRIVTDDPDMPNTAPRLIPRSTAVVDVYQRDILGQAYSVTFDFTGKKKLVEYGFDGNGMQSYISQEAPSGERVTTRFIYDRNLLVEIQSENKDGITLGTNQSIRYDRNGNKTSHTDERNHTASWTYDGFDREYTHTDRLGTVRTTTLDRNSNEDEITWEGKMDTNERRTVLRRQNFEQDEINRVIKRWDFADASQSKDALLREWHYSGNLLDKVVGAGGNFVYTYYPNQRVKTSTDVHGNVTTFLYNKAGQIDSVKEREIEVSVTAGQKGNQVVKTPKPYHTINTYSGLGTRRSSTDHSIHTSYEYYDSDHNLRGTVDINGKFTEFVFDGLGQKVQKIVHWPDGDEITDLTYVGGNLTSIQDPYGATRNFTYDDRGYETRITEESAVGKRTTEILADSSGNWTEVTDPNQTKITREFDPTGKPTTLSVVSGTADAMWDYMGHSFNSIGGATKVVKDYDGLGRAIYGRTEQTGPDQVSYVTTVHRIYDGLDRISDEKQLFNETEISSASNKTDRQTVSTVYQSNKKTTTYPADFDALAEGSTFFSTTYFDESNREYAIRGEAEATYYWDGKNRIAHRHAGLATHTRYAYDDDRKPWYRALYVKGSPVWTEFIGYRPYQPPHQPFVRKWLHYNKSGETETEQVTTHFDVRMRPTRVVTERNDAKIDIREKRNKWYENGRLAGMIDYTWDAKAKTTKKLQATTFVSPERGRPKSSTTFYREGLGDLRLKTRDELLTLVQGKTLKQWFASFFPWSTSEPYSGKQQFYYDDIGNLIDDRANDGKLEGHLFAYDHAGRPVQVHDRRGVVHIDDIYIFDAFGRRVATIASSEKNMNKRQRRAHASIRKKRLSTRFIYDANRVIGELVYDPYQDKWVPWAAYVYGAGELLYMARRKNESFTTTEIDRYYIHQKSSGEIAGVTNFQGNWKKLGNTRLSTGFRVQTIEGSTTRLPLLAPGQRLESNGLVWHGAQATFNHSRNEGLISHLRSEEFRIGTHQAHKLALGALALEMVIPLSVHLSATYLPMIPGAATVPGSAFIGGTTSVAANGGLSWMAGTDYSLHQGLMDFGIGALSAGLGTWISHAANGARAAIAADIALEAGIGIGGDIYQGIPWQEAVLFNSVAAMMTSTPGAVEAVRVHSRSAAIAASLARVVPRSLARRERLLTEALRFANAVAPTLDKKKRMGFAALVDGKVYTGLSAGRDLGDLQPSVRRVLGHLEGRAHRRSGGTGLGTLGKCAEPGCISEMLRQGINPRGALFTAFWVSRSRNPRWHFKPAYPCKLSCRWLTSWRFGMHWISSRGGNIHGELDLPVTPGWLTE